MEAKYPGWGRLIFYGSCYMMGLSRALFLHARAQRNISRADLEELPDETSSLLISDTLPVEGPRTMIAHYWPTKLAVLLYIIMAVICESTYYLHSIIAVSNVASLNSGLGHIHRFARARASRPPICFWSMHESLFLCMFSYRRNTSCQY